MDHKGNQDTDGHLILICVDDTEQSMLALTFYLKYFYRKDHAIALFHVYHHPEVPAFGKHHGNPEEVEEDDEYKRRLDDAMQKSVVITNQFQRVCKQRGIVTRVCIVAKNDSIGHTICSFIKENDIKCVIMGQRGLGAIKRTIFGSVSEYVLHHSRKPVLIVPPEKNHK